VDSAEPEIVPHYQGAEACAVCHAQDSLGAPLPTDNWAGTMMANAVRDPLFLAATEWAEQAVPGTGSFCLGCHAPIGATRGHTEPADGSALDAIDEQGVGCEACHLAASADPDEPYVAGNALLVYPMDGVVRGPYGDATNQGHESVRDANLSSSAFCGQCHLVTTTNEFISINGYSLGSGFPLDTTYLEWQQSEFADSDSELAAGCVDCHMRPAEGELPVSNVADSPLRQNPRSHAVVGGNVWGIQAVMAADPDHAAANAAAFELAIAESLAQLSRAVSVRFTRTPEALVPGETVAFRVEVENLTGHKFPTGFADSRRAWIQVVGIDSDGGEVVLVGELDPLSGEFVDERGTHVYHAVPGRWQGESGVEESNLALQDMVLVDTRIPPKGFRASALTAPTPEFKFIEYPYATIDYVDSLGNYRNTDEAELQALIPLDATGLVALEARVMYQAVTRHYVEELREGLAGSAAAETLDRVYEATGEGEPLVAVSVRFEL
jgi:hypothetical protein